MFKISDHLTALELSCISVHAQHYGRYSIAYSFKHGNVGFNNHENLLFISKVSKPEVKLSIALLYFRALII